MNQNSFRVVYDAEIINLFQKAAGKEVSENVQLLINLHVLRRLLPSNIIK